MKKIIRISLLVFFIIAMAYFAADEVESVAWKARFWYIAGFVSFIMIANSLYAAVDTTNISGPIRKLADASGIIATILMVAEVFGWCINAGNLITSSISSWSHQFPPALSAICGWPSFLSIWFLIIWITTQESSISEIENLAEQEREEKDRTYYDSMTIDEKVDRIADRLTSY